MEYFLIPLFALFVLWLGSKILEKAGISKWWVLCLLLPIVNIFMLWVFAFMDWPNLNPEKKLTPK